MYETFSEDIMKLNEENRELKYKIITLKMEKQDAVSRYEDTLKELWSYESTKINEMRSEFENL